jgi:glycine betaine/proline transport system substrate-binding protein
MLTREHPKRPNSLLRLLAILLILVFGLVACGDGAEAEGEVASEDEGDQLAEGTGELECGTVEIGLIPWDEDIAATFLWKEILERQGLEVEETQLDVAPTFQGVADGSLDLFLDAWLPSTHGDYQERFGADYEDLGVWYEPALLTIAVPEYVDVDSLEDLAENGDLFENRIVGIEPGAGLTRVTREEVMPAYGLEDWTLVESSTPAMLAELQRAIEAEEPIVVTLWRPHWAYAEMALKDLEDPQGALGDPEEIHAIASTQFVDECPTVAEWVSNFELTADQLAELEAMVLQAGDGNEQEAAAEWIDENQDVVDAWLDA